MRRQDIPSPIAALPARELTSEPEDTRHGGTQHKDNGRCYRFWSFDGALKRLHMGTTFVLAMIGFVLLGNAMLLPQPVFAIICNACDPGGGGGGGGGTPPPPATPAQGEAKPVRLTSWVGNWYLKAWGEWNNDVYADVQVPGEGDDSWETWYLVDWNGGLLRSGDPVSLATKQEREPWYLRAQNGGCTAGALADTRARATIATGIGTQETWTLLKVAKSSNSSSDDVIRAGDAVAFRSSNGCHLDFAGGPSQRIRVDDSTLDDYATWRLWQKILPAENDDFPGHADWCFGGQGPGCWNNPGYGDDRWSLTSDAYGNLASIKQVGVTVGSIAHDQCCLRRPLGKNCGGVFSGNEWSRTQGRNPGRGTMAVMIPFAEIWAHNWCESEWQKAWDSDTFFKWPKTFGTYTAITPCPNCQTTGKDGWGYPSDVLFKVATPRDTQMPFSRLFPTYSGNPYNGYNESTYHIWGTGNIYAPYNQPIQSYGDRDFCASGSARYVWPDYKCW